MPPAQEVKKRMEGKPTEQVIIELLLPSGAVWKRSPPMSKENAERRMELYKGATTFTAQIVPADKYKRESGAVETLGDLADKPKGYRSRVE